jgi:hypothetical protein
MSAIEEKFNADTEMANRASTATPVAKQYRVMKGGVFLQVRMMMWKNFKLKAKKPCSTISELILPVIVVLLLSLLRTIPEITPKDIPRGKLSRAFLKGFERSVSIVCYSNE